MQGSFQVDPRTILWGPLRYSYADEGEPVETVVRMPHGDDHHVTLQLQQRVRARKRLPSRAQHGWGVHWSTRVGIPTKPGDRGRVLGSGVDISAESVREGTWVAEACAGIAADMTRNRTRYGYRLEAVA